MTADTPSPRTEQLKTDIISERYGKPLKAALLLCDALDAELTAAKAQFEEAREEAKLFENAALSAMDTLNEAFNKSVARLNANIDAAIAKQKEEKRNE